MSLWRHKCERVGGRECSRRAERPIVLVRRGVFQLYSAITGIPRVVRLPGGSGQRRDGRQKPRILGHQLDSIAGTCASFHLG
jgi:hypothetical protein